MYRPSIEGAGDGLGRLASVAAVGTLLVLGLAFALYRFPPPSLGLILIGGLGLLGLVALAIARYEWAVALGFMLIGFVQVEPAPTDLVFALVIAVAATTGRFDLSRVPLSIGAALGAFIVLNVLSTTEAIDPKTAGFFFSITAYMAVFSIWLAGFIDRESRARSLMLAYLFAAITAAAIGLAAYWLPIPGRANLLYGPGGADERIKSLFKDANVFGPFLIPAALMMLEEILQPRLIQGKRVLKGLAFTLLAVAVLFSFSRAAWGNLILATIAMLAVMSIRRGGGKRAAGAIVALAVAAVIAATVISISGSFGFLGQRAGLQAYDTNRFGAQANGIQIAESHPLGIGPGQFRLAANLDAHSLYVRAFAEQGVLGLLSLLVLVGATLMLATRNALTGRHTYGIGSATLFGAWLGLLLNSFFVDTIHWRHLWVVAALIWAGSMRKAPEASADERSYA